MADAFTKVQFMEPPTYGGVGAVPVGAVKAGSGIEILPDGTINVTQGGGTINNIICTNGIQGGGTTPEVFIGLLPPTSTTIGGVYTVDGSGISIDTNGLIRAVATADISAGAGINVTDLGDNAFQVSLRPATSTIIGGVSVDQPSASGLILQPTGDLKLSPPESGGIGGVKAGTGCTIDADGTLNATGTGGTITAVGAGTGLGGGGSQGAVTVFLKPSDGTTIGGVYAGDNVTIAADGRLSVSSDAGVQSVTGNEPIQVGGTAADPVISVLAATSTAPGVVQLSNDPTTPNVNTAATSTAVNQVYVTANNALPKAGGTMSGTIDFTAGQTFPGTIDSGTFTQLGGILVGDDSPPGYAQLPVGNDGQVLAVSAGAPLGVSWVNNGTGTVTRVVGVDPIVITDDPTQTPVVTILDATISNKGAVQLLDSVSSTSTTAAATPAAVKNAYDLAASALPLTGGSMTGDINFNAGQTFPGVLALTGGTMTGDIVFSPTQIFEGVVNAIGGGDGITVSGTAQFPVVSADIATPTSLGVVQPDGTTIEVDGAGILSLAAAVASPTLQNVTDNGNTTNGTIICGAIQAAGLIYPVSDGPAFYQLTTNGSGVLTWEPRAGTLEEVLLQGNRGDTSLIIGGPSTTTTIGLNYTTWTDIEGNQTLVGPTGITLESDQQLDPTIQLIASNGTIIAGQLDIAGLLYPTADGTPGQVLTTDGSGGLGWSDGGGMTNPMTTIGDIIYSQSTGTPGTPARLGAGANNTILAINAGMPAWRSSTQLGLLTASAAASTYAPLDNPTFTGPVIVDAGGGAGAEALVVSGGNLVLSTSYTPPSSSSTGSVGELAWDDQFLYFCYLPNTWGRVAVDLTPF